MIKQQVGFKSACRHGAEHQGGSRDVAMLVDDWIPVVKRCLLLPSTLIAKERGGIVDIVQIYD